MSKTISTAPKANIESALLNIFPGAQEIKDKIKGLLAPQADEIPAAQMVKVKDGVRKAIEASQVGSDVTSLMRSVNTAVGMQYALTGFFKLINATKFDENGKPTQYDPPPQTWGLGTKIEEKTFSQLVGTHLANAYIKPETFLEDERVPEEWGESFQKRGGRSGGAARNNPTAVSQKHERKESKEDVELMEIIERIAIFIGANLNLYHEVGTGEYEDWLRKKNMPLYLRVKRWIASHHEKKMDVTDLIFLGEDKHSQDLIGTRKRTTDPGDEPETEE